MFSKHKTLEALKLSAIQKILLLLLSIFVTLTLFQYFSISSFFGSLLPFSAALVVLFFNLMLFTSSRRPDTRTSIIIGIFSGTMATAVLIGDKINITENAPILFSLKDVLYWLTWLVFIYCFFNFFIYHAQKLSAKMSVANKKKISKKLWLQTSLAIFIFWTPYLLVYFPGILNSDTSDQLSQALGDTPLNNQHPVLVALFISLFTHIALFLSNNFYAAIALTTVAQMAIAALTLGYSTVWLSARFHSPSIYTLAVAFFALFPLVPHFMITIGKDTLFALSILLFVMALYDLALSKGSLLKNKGWLSFFILVMLMVIFTRNNGIYVVLFTAATLLLSLRQYWKQTIPTLVFVVVFSIFIMNFIYSILNIRLSPAAESFGMMLQQIGRTTAMHGNLSNDDVSNITPLLPIEKWRRYYSPATPDRLKFCFTKADACLNGEYLNEHVAHFLSTWLSIGIKNPRPYLEAFLVQSSGFWRIGGPDEYGNFQSDEKKYTAGSVDLVRSTTGFRASSALQKSIHSLRNSPLGILINQGSLVWILLFTGTILILYRQYSILITLSPLFGLWLSLMLAAPAMSFRYSLSIFLAIPILIALGVAYSKSDKRTSR